MGRMSGGRGGWLKSKSAGQSANGRMANERTMIIDSRAAMMVQVMSAAGKAVDVVSAPITRQPRGVSDGRGAIPPMSAAAHSHLTASPTLATPQAFGHNPIASQQQFVGPGNPTRAAEQTRRHRTRRTAPFQRPPAPKCGLALTPAARSSTERRALASRVVRHVRCDRERRHRLSYHGRLYRCQACRHPGDQQAA